MTRPPDNDPPVDPPDRASPDHTDSDGADGGAHEIVGGALIIEGADGRAGSPRRDRMLSELAAELRAARDEHRRDITRLRTDLLGQLIPRVNTLDTELAELAERLDLLFVRALAGRGDDADDGADGKCDRDGEHGADGGLGDATTGDGGAAAIDWPSLSAAAAEREWQALGDWVASVLGPFYELTRAQLPDCWPRHRPAVIELVWLRRTYVAAHTAEATPAAAAEWHTRWRPAALASIAAAVPDTWCRPGEHYVDRWSTRTPAGGPPPPQPPSHRPGQRPGPEQHKIGAGAEIATPQRWGPHFQAAAGEDIAWRRHREAAAQHSGGGPLTQQ